ncbi:16753_t:CDS:2, partial [Racocetra fulgida]
PNNYATISCKVYDLEIPHALLDTDYILADMPFFRACEKKEGGTSNPPSRKLKGRVQLNTSLSDFERYNSEKAGSENLDKLYNERVKISKKNIANSKRILEGRNSSAFL